MRKMVVNTKIENIKNQKHGMSINDKHKDIPQHHNNLMQSTQRS